MSAGYAQTPTPEESLERAGADQYAQGFCTSCARYHSLGRGNVLPYAWKLMEKLTQSQSIMLRQDCGVDAKRLATDYLFGTARGKMFGVLLGRNLRGEECVCYAFSGQYQGLWRVSGWVDPIVDSDAFTQLTRARESKILEYTRRLAFVCPAEKQYQALRRTRKRLSQSLMTDIHALYVLRNFRGETRSLADVFDHGAAPPAGTGDCCAPKLLNHAVLHRIQPEGLVEFYWGRANASATRLHGRFYPPCRKKCRSILGFLLCGLSKEDR
ncbi:MAG: hypothetical protein CSA33_08970 [Desulfobulbus propionicus]|nr:MAG: hypothetical protein CSA33_08970 [Desulfobulbus propionicus]